MHNQTPPLDGPKRGRRDQYRPLLTVFTVLLALGLLTAAFWPSNPARGRVSAPAPVPPGTGASSPATPDSSPATGASQTTGSPPAPGPLPATGPNAGPPLTDLPTTADEKTFFVEHGDRTCQQIALTYDAGSGADGAAAILDVLQKHRLTATFFLTGKWVERYPDLARRIAAEGHLIANHTYSHPDLTKLPPNEVIKEVADGEAAIARITGKETRPLFREPYGAFDDTERRLVRQAGFTHSVYWDVDTLDWQFPPLETLVNRLLERPKNGSVVLMHLNVPVSATATDQAVPVLQARGFTFVTIPQVLTCPH